MGCWFIFVVTNYTSFVFLVLIYHLTCDQITKFTPPYRAKEISGSFDHVTDDMPVPTQRRRNKSLFIWWNWSYQYNRTEGNSKSCNYFDSFAIYRVRFTRIILWIHAKQAPDTLFRNLKLEFNWRRDSYVRRYFDQILWKVGTHTFTNDGTVGLVSGKRSRKWKSCNGIT